MMIPARRSSYRSGCTPALEVHACHAPIETKPSRNNGVSTQKQLESIPSVAANLRFCATIPGWRVFGFSSAGIFYARQLPFVLVLLDTAFGSSSERLVMNGDKVDSNTTSIPSVSLFRGIYNRVAKRLGVDPSYVSRVARGERKSAVVEKALAEEVRLIRDHLNNHQDGHNSNNNNNNNHSSFDQKEIQNEIPSRRRSRGLA